MLFAVKRETIKMGKWQIIIHIYFFTIYIYIYFNLLSVRFLMSMEHGKLENLFLFV